MTEYTKVPQIHGCIHGPYELRKKSPYLRLYVMGKRFTEDILDKNNKLTEIYL